MDLDALRTRLLAARSADGAWGYTPGTASAPEPTLHAVAAGLPTPVPWLDRPLGWGESLLLAARPVDLPAPRHERAVEAVLAAHGEAIDETAGTVDGSLVGWSWVAGTFSWLEPTVWAIVGLHAAGRGDHPRVAQGQAVLLDRQAVDGSYNFGSPNALGSDLPGYPHSTAIALLALPRGTAADRAFAWLHATLAERSSAFSLALAVLAARRHERDATLWQADLDRRQRTDGSIGGGHHVEALALLAATIAPGHPYLGVPLG